MCDCDGRITVWEDDPNYVKKEEFVPNNPLERPKINYLKPIIAFLAYFSSHTARRG